MIDRMNFQIRSLFQLFLEELYTIKLIVSKFDIVVVFTVTFVLLKQAATSLFKNGVYIFQHKQIRYFYFLSHSRYNVYIYARHHNLVADLLGRCLCVFHFCSDSNCINTNLLLIWGQQTSSSAIKVKTDSVTLYTVVPVCFSCLSVGTLEPKAIPCLNFDLLRNPISIIMTLKWQLYAVDKTPF